jgi:hypothetical protein
LAGISYLKKYFSLLILFCCPSISRRSYQERNKSLVFLNGGFNRKNRITIPAFPYLRILPGRSEDRPQAGQRASGSVGIRRRRRSYYVIIGLERAKVYHPV